MAAHITGLKPRWRQAPKRQPHRVAAGGPAVRVVLIVPARERVAQRRTERRAREVVAPVPRALAQAAAELPVGVGVGVVGGREQVAAPAGREVGERAEGVGRAHVVEALAAHHEVGGSAGALRHDVELLEAHRRVARARVGEGLGDDVATDDALDAALGEAREHRTEPIEVAAANVEDAAGANTLDGLEQRLDGKLDASLDDCMRGATKGFRRRMCLGIHEARVRWSAGVRWPAVGSRVE